jgi:flagellar basal-body rod protein FlgG
MHPTLAVTLQSMQQDLARVQSIAANLANASTTGFKRAVVAARPFADLLQAANAAAAPGDAGGLALVTDARAGTLRLTGHPFDVALAGEGLFEVRTAQGTAYTRQGDFHVDAGGRLVTARGDPVLGQGGEITLLKTPVTIDAAGRIFDASATAGGAPERPLAQLRVVQPDDRAGLTSIGDGLLSAASAVTPMAESAYQVRQGYLENSNVNPMQEMVQLMQALRHFESMQKVAQGTDDMLSTAIHKLGEL